MNNGQSCTSKTHNKEESCESKTKLKGKKTMKLDDLSNQQISNIIDNWIRGERNRNLLKRRLIDGICYEPLAEEFDLSVCQVKNIIYKEQDKLFKKIEEL